MFPWAKFRRVKGGIKAHVLRNHDDYLPGYVQLTEAKLSDVKMADSFRPNPGSIESAHYHHLRRFPLWLQAVLQNRIAAL